MATEHGTDIPVYDRHDLPEDAFEPDVRFDRDEAFRVPATVGDVRGVKSYLGTSIILACFLSSFLSVMAMATILAVLGEIEAAAAALGGSISLLTFAVAISLGLLDWLKSILGGNQ